FRFNQCLLQKLKELGFQKQYNDSDDNDLESVKALFQRTAALSFVPLDEIDAL
ncbi:unnamed protein product, partial [Didymodactylos carnosus]